MKNKISRSQSLLRNSVFVDGLPGCGKTLVSQLISGLSRVEILSYSYEIEHICQLKFLDKISDDAAVTMIRLQSDLKLYNIMMARDLNFRRNDISSVYNNHSPGIYFERLFSKGDEIIPEKVGKKDPILNIATHNLLSFGRPVFDALGDRCTFVEVVRHPLYMIRQLALNFERLDNNVRNFTLHYLYGQDEVPFYTRGWEDKFLKASAMGKAVMYMREGVLRNEQLKKDLKNRASVNIVTVPFERLVLDPEPWIKLIADAIGSHKTEVTSRVMIEQRVPRLKIADGIDLEIYRRCGWTPPEEGASERDELNLRRMDVIKGEGASVISILDELCKSYEIQYWAPLN